MLSIAEFEINFDINASIDLSLFLVIKDYILRFELKLFSLLDPIIT